MATTLTIELNDGHDDEGTMSDAVEHVARMVAEGFTSGEVMGDGKRAGWWSIDHIGADDQARNSDQQWRDRVADESAREYLARAYPLES